MKRCAKGWREGGRFCLAMFGNPDLKGLMSMKIKSYVVPDNHIYYRSKFIVSRVDQKKSVAERFVLLEEKISKKR